MRPRSFACFALTLAAALGTAPAARAQTQIRPRFLIAFDTSGSMTVDLDNIPTFGDGIAGPTRGLDTDCDGLADDSRMYVAKEALRNVVLAFGDIEFALARFPMYSEANAVCNDASGLATGLRIQDNECNISMGPFVGSVGDPTANTGALINNGNCGAEWDGTAGSETPFELYPAACRPSGARMWGSGSPTVCLNYIGACPDTDFPGIYTFPDGDVLVGFQGHGWPGTLDNRPGILKWIDNAETNFSASTTTGNFCNHSGAGDCELRANGPTPLGGLLRASADYITPIRMADPDGACRPYTVLLLTDGFEVCNPDTSSPDHPVNVAGELFGTYDIPVYVVGLAVSGGRAQLNAIATAGGTDAGAPGGDTAFFADDPVTLAAGLADIVNDSLLVEVCNDADDDCDTLVDEGFVKYCDRPSGTTSAVLCTDPGETVCDGMDDNCNGLVDEGLLNACGTCGPAPAEVCDGVDNDCDGAIDEGGVCSGCIPASEICDAMDNDCDMAIDEDLERACGVDLGECRSGTQTCTAGTWGACDDVGPSAEVCDGLDNDCDGLPDNLTRPCGTDVGECTPGIERCTGGSWGACEGGVGPEPEACNGLDDDCDGDVDEDVPGEGVACGSDVGICMPGTTACVGGTLTCTGGTSPMPEACNGLDDDCDGIVDDGIPVGAPCGSDVGECSPGIEVCVGGALECTGAVGPTDEVCNTLDDDCDGSVDEGLPVGDACGSDLGICMEGTIACVDGREVCVGEVPPRRESCNCDDDDCDGTVDETPDVGPLCPPGSTCVDCQCALPCGMTEFGYHCPTGKNPKLVDGECFCVAPRCDTAACAEETIEEDGEVRCAPDREDVAPCVCRDNACTHACDGVDCAAGLVCNPRDPRGRCVEDSCRGLGCLSGEICNAVSGECEPDPCVDTECAADEACRLGTCEDSCATVTCEDGESCHAGRCVEDPCAGASCGAGEACDPETGDCIEDRCLDVRCPVGAVCDPVSGECVVDPCVPLHCPEGQVCARGECALPGMDAGPGAGPDNRRVLATGGGGCICAAPGASPSGSPAGALGLAAFLLGLLGLRRRARVRTAAARWLPLLLTLLVALFAGGCDVDPFCIDCADEARDAGQPRDAGREDAPARPVDAQVDAELPDGCVPGAPELCNDHDDDCDGEVDEDVDTSSDPNNCGACGNVCAPPHAFGECTDGECGLGDCDVGWLDLDGDPDNGCEYDCLPAADDDSMCNRRDDDCDGDVDEDVDLDTDPMNCGRCGQTCRIAHATPECVAGACAVADCDDFFFDLDGDPSNGCEYGCAPADPPTEVCNGRDDDCDGDVDEGDPGGGGACGSSTGECTEGVEHCVSGVIVCTGGTGPAVETCNTLDDDCDGDVDETIDFDSDPSNCGACGTSCSLPHAVTRCSSGSCTFVACESGYHDIDASDPGCEYACEFRGSEVCNGDDDDCDGDTDEGLSPPSTFCNPNGVCAGTTPACSGASGWTCTYTHSEYEASETLCDGLDNDCDGSIDEPFPLLGTSCSNGIGACRRNGSYECSSDGLTAVCNAGMAGTPGTESCDGTDEDCDGRIDEGLMPGSDGVATVEMSIPTGGTVWMMSYEASRPNATSSSAGTVSTAACSRANRIPWTNVTWMEAQAACCALNAGGSCPSGATSDGWRLCDAEDWEMACQGPTASCTWAYSTGCSTSAPTRCNGAEYDCDTGAAGTQDCLFPTGSSTFPSCRMPWGSAGSVHDLSGNVKEWTHTEVAPSIYAIRGGAYNNLEAGRACTFDFTVGDAAFSFPNTGFRCCYYDFP